MSQSKKYYFFILPMAINMFCTHFVYAQTTESRWWNANELLRFNVERDLKVSRIGTNWYVDGVNGDDVNGNGTSLAPWKTIGKAFDHYSGRPAPGDVVLIKAGVYRERLIIRSQGTHENRILIGACGDGEVIIDCSDKVEGWTLHKGNVYKAQCSFQPTAIVMDETPLFPEISIDALGAGKWFYDAKEKMLYLFVSDKGGPAIHDIGIVSDDGYQDGILINGGNYITLYGLTVKYAGGRGISILGSHNRVEKCNIKFNGGIGINMFNYNEILSDDTQVIKNHIHCNFLRNWPRGRYKWGGWGGGAISQSTPNTQYIGNIVYNNGGEGLVVHSGNGGSVIKDNIVYDNWSVNIYIDNQPNGIIDGNLIYCHEPNSKDLYNNGDTDPSDGKNIRRLRAEGIMTADEKYGANSLSTLRNIRISNNIILGCRRGITHYAHAQGSGLKDVQVVNNTVVVPNAEGVGEEYIGISVPYNNGNNSNTIYANNIVYASHPKTYLLSVETPLSFGRADFQGIYFSHNLWYHLSNSKPFHVGPRWLNIYNINFMEWQKKCKANGQCSSEIYNNPKLKDASGYYAESARLSIGSPAIDVGIGVKDVLVDYDDKPRLSPPDIGAIEFN